MHTYISKQKPADKEPMPGHNEPPESWFQWRQHTISLSWGGAS